MSFKSDKGKKYLFLIIMQKIYGKKNRFFVLKCESLHALDRFQSYKKDFEAKYDKLMNEVCNERAMNKVQKEEIISLKALVEKQTTENGEICRLLEEKERSLCEKIHQLQSSQAAVNSNSIIITSLNKDLQDLRSQVLDLASKLRSTLSEKEQFESKCVIFSEKFASLSETSESIDVLCVKFDDMKTEHGSYRHKLSQVTDKLVQAEVESASYKLRCDELNAQVARLENEALEARVQIENLKLERDASQASKETVEKDVSLLKTKLTEVNKVWLETQKELEAKDGHYRKFEADVEQIEVAVEKEVYQFKEFRRDVASLLTDDYFTCEPTVEEIKEKVKLLMVSSKHRGLVSICPLF